MRNDVSAIVVQDMRKTFRLPHEQVHTLKERALHPFRKTAYERFQALKGVSFSVEPGAFYGIVGRNGSGKSTLLKCLAGIYKADSGTAWVRGRMSTFIELGVGFNLDLAARDNILLNGVMLGLSSKETKRRADEVIEFAGLQQFTDLKVKNYSSGMLVRLGFAVLIHIEADVLLIDEVLAVGDAEFQQKCHEEFAKIRKSGKTVLLVTHDMGAVERYCDQAMLLEAGEKIADGPAHEVALEYLDVNFTHRDQLHHSQQKKERNPEEKRRYGDGAAKISFAAFVDENNVSQETLRHGQKATFLLKCKFIQDVENPIFGFALKKNSGENVFASSTRYSHQELGTVQAGKELSIRFTFHNVLSADRYTISPAIAHSGGQSWVDYLDEFSTVIVTNPKPTGALVDIPSEAEVHFIEEQ